MVRTIGGAQTFIKAAFEDKNFEPLTLSEYFEIEIEIALQTAEGVISHRA